MLNTMFKAKQKELETVSCEECKCILYKVNAEKVIYNHRDIYYCQAHKKPYSRVLHVEGWLRADGKDDVHYYAEVEVTKEGTPLTHFMGQ